MRKFGVIGNPITHSFSPDYFKAKFSSEQIEAEYHAFELENAGDIQTLVTKEKLSGFNVTIPFKTAIISQLDKIDSAASEIGAVNTVNVVNGKMVGYNTDWTGFLDSLTPHLEPNTQALILGTGGASKAITYALRKQGVSYRLVSRKEGVGLNYSDVNTSLLANFKLLVNTTPLGLHPNVAEYPDIDYKGLGNQHLCYDLIYNPEQSLFLTKALQQGATIMNGLEMLKKQADKSWDIWNH